MKNKTAKFQSMWPSFLNYTGYFGAYHDSGNQH